jgi:alanine dehydrogenase
MSEMRIGLIKENKVPIDRRVPMTPEQCRLAMEKFPQIKIVVQSSDIRCFTDENYIEEGIEVVENVEDCDVLMGVKELPKELLIPNKTYFFFSHTIKEQEYNRDLLRTVLQKNIRLIDYEVLTDKDHKRIIAFGRYAGIVGAYNGIWTFGKRYHLFDIRRAHKCFDLEDLKSEFEKVKLPAIKIAITGGGRVARGAIEVLHGMKIRRVTPAEYLSQKFDEPVFTQLNSRDYHVRRDGGEFSREEFHSHPERYKSTFDKFTHQTDLLIAGAFWNPASPVLFTREDSMKHEFRIHVIADITCDIEGSIPSTKQPSTIDDPIYDYNPSDDKVEKPFSEEANITVMAVDNLPCELPRDASRDFGQELINNVLPQFWNNDEDDILSGATIAENGKLTESFSYLSNYAGLS